MEILIPILAVTAIGLICGVGLAVASSVMAVKEDTRFTEIRECLPGANCGACGYTGCDGYAKALLEPGTKTNLCVPGADAVAVQIAALLGVEAEDVVEKIAVVQCAGTCEATSVKADYRGIPSCAAKAYPNGARWSTLPCSLSSSTRAAAGSPSETSALDRAATRPSSTSLIIPTSLTALSSPSETICGSYRARTQSRPHPSPRSL